MGSVTLTLIDVSLRELQASTSVCSSPSAWESCFWGWIHYHSAGILNQICFCYVTDEFEISEIITLFYFVFSPLFKSPNTKHSNAGLCPLCFVFPAMALFPVLLFLVPVLLPFFPANGKVGLRLKIFSEWFNQSWGTSSY